MKRALFVCVEECPLVRSFRREDSKIPDPRQMNPGQLWDVRDLSERKVKDLLASLEEMP